MSHKDRFDLEEAIMSAWNTANDLELIAERHIDGEIPLNEDELANVLIGLKIIHNFRCEKLFSIFEHLLETNQFSEEKSIPRFATDEEVGFVENREKERERSQKQKDQWRNYVNEKLEHPSAKADDQKNIEELREKHD